MAFTKQTIEDASVAGKTVLLRADYNVPLDDGEITDDLRIKSNLPTLKYLLEHGAAVVICSHLGRPEGKVDPSFSLKPVAAHLQKLMNMPVQFVDDCIGAEAQKPRRPGEIVLLENLRFYPEEELNDTAFAQKLASGKDLYVDDAFGVVHHPAASLVAVTQYLPSVAGYLLQKEVTIITEAMERPAHPFVAVMGGAKISDKIELIEAFLNKVDILLIGGAMANTFFAATDMPIGKSKYDPDDIEEARRLVKLAADKGVKLLLPTKDAVVAPDPDKPEAKQTIDLVGISEDDMILDIGPQSLKEFNQALAGAKTIIWNGTIGVTEVEAFANGSRDLANAIASSGATTIVGGGDTAGFIDEIGMLEDFTHVSTGGGASLELMAGKKLPGVEALLDKA